MLISDDGLLSGFSVDDVVGVARPGDGDVDVLGEVSARVGQVASGFSTYRYELGRAEASLSTLKSVAVSNLAQNIHSYCAGSVASCQADAEQFARGVSVYRSNLVDLKSRQRSLISQIEDALWACSTNATELAYAMGMSLVAARWRWDSWLAVQALIHANPQTAGGAFEGYNQRWQHAVSELKQLQKSWSDLVKQRGQDNANFLSLMKSLHLYDQAVALRLTDVEQTIRTTTTISPAILAEIYQLLSAGTLSVNEIKELCDTLPPEGLRILATTYPELIGNLDGVPATVRIQANQNWAGQHWDDPGLSAAESKYLKEVADGDRKLYLYDSENERVIEVVGEISDKTKDVVTYVPGTDASMGNFYDGSVQRFSQGLVDADQTGGTAVFIYKDGPWVTWTGDRANSNNEYLERKGTELADFESVINADPTLSGKRTAVVAHSAGNTIAAYSEIHGAHYDDYVSLSGSYLPSGWKPEPGTEYDHYQYHDDPINSLDLMYSTPHDSPVFEHHDEGSGDGNGFGGLANHDRISRNDDNKSTIRDVHNQLEN